MYDIQDHFNHVIDRAVATAARSIVRT
jgi:hypothetical protein